MFGRVAAFEFRFQTRQPVFWVAMAVFALLTFGLTASDNVSIGGGGNVRENAPFAVVQAHTIFSIFFLFAMTAFVANAVVRDDETGFGPIVRSTHIGKATYLYGRFAGAFAAATLAFTAVPIGMMVGTAMPWLDPETLGPFRPGDYLYAYSVMALPNLLFVGALLFALATVTRSMMATYLGLIGVVVLYFVGLRLIARPELKQAAAVIEPFGVVALGVVTEYWTAAERNSRLPSLEGVFLANRLLKVGLALACLAAAYVLFRFDTVGVRAERRGRRVKADEPAPTSAAAAVTGRFDAGTGWAQFRRRTRFEVSQTVRSPAFAILIGLFLLLTVPQLWFATTPFYDSRIFPVTRVMVETLRGAYSLAPILIAIYYGGELVWRERERRVHEIVGAAPVSDWALLAPKVAAIAFVLVAALLVAVIAAVGVQLAQGYTDIEPGKYLVWWLIPQTIDMLLLAVLAVFLQSIAPHKFVGWLLMLLYVVAAITLDSLGFGHNLILYPSAPSPELSDMNGLGRAGVAQAWFQAYWTAFAVLLLAAAYVLWSRGGQGSLRSRLRDIPRRLKGAPGLVTGGALVAFVALGSFIYVNTNVWNDYRTDDEQERWAADYEKTLLRYETLPQPKIVDVRLDVDIRPEAGTVATQGVYLLENRTGEPLRRLDVRFERDLQVTGLTVEGARADRAYSRFNYRIFAFDTPLQPGERRRLTFATLRSQRGFKNDGSGTGVLENGTFLNNQVITPLVGMGRDSLLRDRNVRRKYGLPRELRPAKLEDQGARAFNQLRRDSDWVTADITVSTSADQTPVAPGYRVSEVVADGRRTVRFRTEAPINHFFSVQSARYAERLGTAGGARLAIYHHPGHAMSTARMETAMRSSLDQFGRAFSPYQFRQARIIEYPAGDFAQSFANTIPYAENLGFISDFRQADRDASKIDVVTYITAHEIAHQWWGHQLVPADMQGGTLLVETLAQYSAMQVMERLYGPEQIRRFLKFELDAYLGARGGEGVEELPLNRVENQQYIHYRKGTLVMYRLKEVIGEEAVNRALRRMLADYAFQSAPYPTSVQLISAFRAEAGPAHQDLITDLFERITLYDVKTTAAESRRRPDGRYDVSVTVEASKLYADGEGEETEAPLGEAVDLGLFTERPGDKAFDRADVVLTEARPLRSGTQTFRFSVARAPEWAGADPYNTLIDRKSGDNLVRVTAR